MRGLLAVFLFALFCIPYAAAVVTRQLRGQIKEAIIYDSFDKSTKTFDNGVVNLYKVDDDESLFDQSYEIEDESGELSQTFDIGQHNTVVTDEKITVRFIYMTIYIFTLDGNNVAFYQKLFSLEDFDHEFPLTRVVRGGETLEDVFAVNAKEDMFNDWILAAVDSSGPRIIFPLRYVEWTQEYEDIDKALSFVVEVGPDVKEITLEFQYSGVARAFYAFVDLHRTPVFKP